MISGKAETNGNTIRPGDVYKYRCDNDQGYGYMIPVKTSKGWDFIDTYQLGVPWRNDGETGDNASIRQIIELGHGEHDGYVNRATSSFYYRNAHFGETKVPYGLHLAFNLSDYNIASRRECENYNYNDVVYNVPLYREQHYSWNYGKAFGLCFVRKGAKKSLINEFKSLLAEAHSSITAPQIGTAIYLLDKIEEKLHELDDLGLSTQEDKDAFSYLANRIKIINKCVEDLKEINRERMAQRRDSDSTGEEMEVDDDQ